MMRTPENLGIQMIRQTQQTLIIITPEKVRTQEATTSYLCSLLFFSIVHDSSFAYEGEIFYIKVSTDFQISI